MFGGRSKVLVPIREKSAMTYINVMLSDGRFCMAGMETERWERPVFAIFL